MSKKKNKVVRIMACKGKGKGTKKGGRKGKGK